MNEREALRELLELCERENEGLLTMNEWIDGLESARSVLAQPEAKDWIPVSERLPEFTYGPEHEQPLTSDDVLVYWPDETIGIAFYDAPDNWYDQQNDKWADCDPTHWMPLPAPSAEEGK
jgi:hypothetical protein